jgi:hypothetical protein
MVYNHISPLMKDDIFPPSRDTPNLLLTRPVWLFAIVAFILPL